MRNCKHTRQVEALFDGERADAALERHAAACPACAAALAGLRRLREGARAATRAASVEDAQFPAFMAGVREQMDAPARRPRGFLAVASLVTAAMVAALATFAIIKGGPDPVRATEVEVSTDIPGAEVGWYDAPDDSITIWINLAEDDL